MTVGYETLDVGEQALVYNHAGSARIEDGPKRLFLWREKFEKLTRYAADQKQYLVVTYKDGRVEHKKGPCVMFKNPIAHKSITIINMRSLDANEALVVYRKEELSKEVTRYIQFGPTLFTPQASEWLHMFSWHGTDPENKTRLVPGIQKFDVLKVIPDQLYYNVDDVRLKDDAAIKVKLMLCFELKDIDTMLNATKDPIADFINCVCADVVAFASLYTYIEFMEKAGQLNDLDNYVQLMERSKTIGYTITKVIYRGYHAHPKLQQLHDNAVETRTVLKINYEGEEQKQVLTDMKLESEKSRKELEQKLEIDALNHKFTMKKAEVKHSLALEYTKAEENNRQWITDHECQLQAQCAKDQLTCDHYSSLKGVGVDLNTYSKSLSGRPEKVVKIVAEKNAANFHLHHS
ncbi:uncharacterized protein LOC110451781 [Mizuhopecten yessoensis]|uniref:Band 7 domain-containing protein n=1 Tax=Mizuhopecten yessoensis TaxID=6573 RepID=A0A210R770_MIZYE|nr:uncharacterized protein LOC110451781 [Mizuhopecten yessoensis]XP_021355752.1 uncharacterized protein LOC110451781 [Mizuhopecten yessoensis]OWF56825.1 hypothetical protein KP79_PYT20752 [Mizuhopecten yessoensis]